MRENTTNIVATLGPASSDAQKLQAMANSGMTIARFNFSHGDTASHTAIRNDLLSVAPDALILQDLCGPKIRTVVSDECMIQAGDIVAIGDYPTGHDGICCSLSLNTPEVIPLLVPGTKIYIEDGLLALQSVECNDGYVLAKVLRGGEIHNKKGVNVPGVDLPVSALTDKDKKDVAWGAENNVDYIALSFVKTSDDIVELRDLLRSLDATFDGKIIAKIETVEAVENISDIIDAADGIMVARGDLGIEIGVEHVPEVQKNIISLCNEKNVPVIVATHMLESMKYVRVPTRAEVSDVFNAVLDGATGVMLSGETSTGIDPIASVTMMREICDEAEKYRRKQH